MQSLHEVLTSYSLVPTKEEAETVVIKKLVKDNGLNNVISEIEIILRSGNEEDIRNVLIFLRDCSLFPREFPEFTTVVKAFRAEIPKSAILKIMCENLSSQNIFIRGETIYTLGKIGFRESIGPLRQVIPKYIEECPDILFRLLFEIFWLEENVDYELLKDLAKLNKSKVNDAIKEYFQISIIDDPVELQKKNEVLELIGTSA